MDKPIEYISLANLIGYDELVVSQFPSELVPEDDRGSEDFYSLKIWRPGRGDFVDTFKFRDRIRAIVKILFTGRFSENSVVLSRDQLMKLSSWIYLHGDSSTNEDYINVP